MSINKKLKILSITLLCFIIVLVGMLVYAKTVLEAANPETSDASDSTVAAVSTNSAESTGAVASVTPGAPSAPETIDLKLYIYDADNYDNYKEVRTVAVEKTLYESDVTSAVNQLLSGTELSINKATVDGSLITVDLSRDIALKFNRGSAGGITLTNTLAMTMVNLPGIEKLEITVDGVPGYVGDHFNFNGTFSKAQDGGKYIFTESDEESKELF